MKESSAVVSNCIQSGAVGILGGTFDPIHCGHMRMAQAALSVFSLTRVILLVAADPPHKRAAAGVQDRLNMASLALEGVAGLELSALEANRPGRTYTVESLRALKDAYPDERLMYIIGSDTLYDLPSWRRADEVTRLCEFIVFHRAGYPKESAAGVISALPELRLHFSVLDIPDVSSTSVRTLAKAGAPLKGLVCPAVEAYIRAHGLYAET